MRRYLMGHGSQAVYSMDGGPGGGGWRPFSNMFSGNKRQPARQQQDDDDGGDTGDQGDPNKKKKAGSDNNSGDSDADSDDPLNFLDEHRDVWEDKDEGNEPDPEEEDRIKARTKEQNETLQNYIKNLNFGVKLDMEKVKESIEGNNPDYLNGVFNNALQRVFAKQFDDFSRMLTAAEGRFKGMVEEMAQTHISARESELSLFDTVPLAKHPAIKPVALAYKSRYMKQGKSDEEANDMVKKVFSTIRKVDAGQLGLEEDDDGVDLTSPPNGKRVQNRNTNKRNRGTDWVAELTRQG